MSDNNENNNIVIHTTDLEKTYGEGESAVPALAGVSLRVRDGEFVSVMGASGSGKSTLLHVLACLHQATGGSYELAGAKIEALNDQRLSAIRSKDVGIVFQKFNLLSQESIVRNVELPLVYARVPKKERERRAVAILKGLGLGHRLKHRPTQLSGGEDQRVAIARALVSSPAVILADEPTGNLDSRTSEDIMAIFQALNRMGKTIVMITHNREIADFGERVVYLKDGLVDRRESIPEPRQAAVQAPDLSFLATQPPVIPRRWGGLSLKRILETFKVAIRGLGVHKVRAFLSMLGIIFGVASVMAVLSVAAGARGEVMKQLKALGANNILITARRLRKEDIKDVQIRSRGLRLADAEEVARQCGLIESWAPLKKMKPQVTLGDKRIDCEVVGTTASFIDVTDFELSEGRFISPIDDQQGLRVCIIEEEIRREQFPIKSPLGKLFSIGHEFYTVIGVLRGKETTGSKFDVADIKQLNRRIYVPLSCALRRLTQPTMQSQLDEVSMKIVSTSALRRAASIVNAFFQKAHHAEKLTPKQRDYEVKIAVELLSKTQKTELIFDIVMGCSAGISLIVGGIGIMNIMLANVTERRREIGIRRSVGARQADILKQFILEALAVCLIGGLLGVGLGLALKWGISAFAHWKTAIVVKGILLSLIVSLVDGLIFGAYPAWKAAKMDPIEALRFE